MISLLCIYVKVCQRPPCKLQTDSLSAEPCEELQANIDHKDIYHVRYTYLLLPAHIDVYVDLKEPLTCSQV